MSKCCATCCGHWQRFVATRTVRYSNCPTINNFSIRCKAICQRDIAGVVDVVYVRLLLYLRKSFESFMNRKVILKFVLLTSLLESDFLWLFILYYCSKSVLVFVMTYFVFFFCLIFNIHTTSNQYCFDIFYISQALGGNLIFYLLTRVNSDLRAYLLVIAAN